MWLYVGSAGVPISHLIKRVVQETGLRRQVLSKHLREVLGEWRSETVFAAHSRAVIAAAVARMSNRSLLAAMDTWRAEASKQRKVSLFPPSPNSSDSVPMMLICLGTSRACVYCLRRLALEHVGVQGPQ